MIDGRFVRNAWYMAGWGEDVAEGKVIGAKILGEPVAIYRKTDGGLAAVQDRCPHRHAPLSLGRVVHGDKIQCIYHGLEFDAAGACTLNPHPPGNIPSRAVLKSYPIAEKHKAIWIWMGDRAPDTARIPDFSVLDNVPELYTTKRDKLTIKANYELVVDNLPDGPFTLDIRNTCAPDRNTQLSGLYTSNGGLFTQCEAEGFRRITYFLDRPDVMASYAVTLRADKAAYPVLLSNGNLVEHGPLDGGRHFAKWVDPHKKPAYLFALVAGELVCREQRIRARSGSEHLLHVASRQLGAGYHAAQSLRADPGGRLPPARQSPDRPVAGREPVAALSGWAARQRRQRRRCAQWPANGAQAD
jgi:nitrite reductase/ring-hydroxylating ferredoxin subunit